MNVLITGAAGFLGMRLARRLLALGELTDRHGQRRPIARLTLLDVITPQDFAGSDDSRVRTVLGDLRDPGLLASCFAAGVDAVFHLAAIVSGQAEAEFDLGMGINLDASRQLLEACRALGTQPKVVFTSSVAVYGGTLPDVVQDDTALNPQSSYGTQKAISELLLGDYSRRGFVDGRVLRLPTISVRPGKPNKAASGFASGIIREPLQGQPAICPVPATSRLWLLSPRKAIESLLVGHELDGAALGKNRIINLPGLSVTVQEMLAALGRVAGTHVPERVLWQRDPAIEQIVCSWPAAWDTQRARALGFRGDKDFDSVIQAFIADELG